MIRIFLVRHGESAWNVTHRYTGQEDPPLSELGRLQAQRLAERLRAEPVEAIYSSAARRAVETAQPIAKLKSLPVVLEPAFLEIHHGLWQGLTVAEVAERFPNEVAMWRDQPQNVQMPNGESLDDVRRRAIPAFRRILGKHPNQSIAIFSHDAVQRVILLNSLGCSFARFWEWRIENASVTILEQQGEEFRLASLNDVAHLEGVAADYESQAL